MQTTGSSRASADKEHRYPELLLDPAACGEMDRPSMSLRHSIPEIRFRSGRASSLRTARNDWQCGTAQARLQVMSEEEACQMESTTSGLAWNRKSNSASRW